MNEVIFSFLSRFKTFTFFLLFFIIFGSVFMLLYESLCTDSTACYSILKPIFKNSIINFTEPKFIVFFYVSGLMLYEFGRVCFKILKKTISLTRDKITNRANKNDKEPNDIEFIIIWMNII